MNEQHTNEITLNAGPNPIMEPAPTPLIGRIADHYAAQHTFIDYTSRKAQNTLDAQRADLAVWIEYLESVDRGRVANCATEDERKKSRNAGYAGMDALIAYLGALDKLPAAEHYSHRRAYAESLQSSGAGWKGITWGMVEGFVKWRLRAGHAINSINRSLTTLKTYARLATKAGAMTEESSRLIATVRGYAGSEARRVNEKRPITRISPKKAEPVRINEDQAKALKTRPDTPQGRRDAVLMCLLLDHGLRAGEVAGLTVAHVDLRRGMLVGFDRPKVDKEQNHKLSADALRALQAWFSSGDAPSAGPLLRGSRKGGHLMGDGMSETSITLRVRDLGAAIGIDGLSAHDCRHYWATNWAGKVDTLRLQEAGGWSSLEMPRRYVKRSEVANEGMA